MARYLCFFFVFSAENCFFSACVWCVRFSTQERERRMFIIFERSRLFSLKKFLLLFFLVVVAVLFFRRKKTSRAAF